MKVSIIIPAYNEESYLPATLESIDAALPDASVETEIIVVDNESTDRTREIAEKFGAQVVMETVHNIARVRNAGAKAASGDVLIFIDADTLVPRPLIQKISAVMEDERCFGGAVAVDYGAFRRKWMKWYMLGWKFWGKFFNMKLGAAQFCRKSIFERLGGYDESIYMGEDVMFYWRLSKFAGQKKAALFFIEDLQVTTSTRRFDKMSLWKTLLLTHPAFILLTAKRKKYWRDWYENIVR